MKRKKQPSAVSTQPSAKPKRDPRDPVPAAAPRRPTALISPDLCYTDVPARADGRIRGV